MNSAFSKQKHILLVEDESNTAQSVRYILEKEGHLVTWATNGRLALEMLCEESDLKTPVDLLLTDIEMPELTGIELVEEIRQAGLDIPFLVITGYGNKSMLQVLMRMGCEDYLDKPFSREDLLERVDFVLKKITSKQHEKKEQESSRKKELEKRLKDYCLRMKSLEQNIQAAENAHDQLMGEICCENFEVAMEQKPLSRLGGDFFQILDHGEKTSIILADVAGHDMGASYHSIMLKTLFDESEKMNSREFLEQVNRMLLHMSHGERLVCLISIEVDRSERKLNLYNAGMPRAVIFDAMGHCRTIPSPPALPLGVDEKLQLQSITTDFKPGERLVLYTDGLEDVSRLQGESGLKNKLGTKRLLQYMQVLRYTPCGNFCIAVLKDVQRYCRHKVDDDLMIACVDYPES